MGLSFFLDESEVVDDVLDFWAGLQNYLYFFVKLCGKDGVNCPLIKIQFTDFLRFFSNLSRYRLEYPKKVLKSHLRLSYAKNSKMYLIQFEVSDTEPLLVLFSHSLFLVGRSLQSIP